MTGQTATRNIIQKQYLHIDFNGMEAEAFALQQMLSDICTHRLTPAIERVLDRYSPPDDHLSIENIRLDVGVLSAAELERELPGLVALAIERELYRIVPPGKSSSRHIAAGFRRTTANRSITEAFIYYLKTGTLPWSFSTQNESAAVTLNSATSPDSPVPFITDEINLEKMILSTWEKAANSGQEPLDDRDGIVRELAGETARKRLVRQFSPAFLTVLLSLLSPEANKAVEKALSAIRHLHIRPDEHANFERLVWETVFSFVAAVRTFSAWDIVTGTHFLGALDRRQSNAALKVLHRYLTGAVIPEEQDDYSGSTGSGYVEADADADTGLHRLKSDRPETKGISKETPELNVSSKNRDEHAVNGIPEQPKISASEAGQRQASETSISKSRAGTAKAAPDTRGKSRPGKSVSRPGRPLTKNSLVSHRRTTGVAPGTHPEAAEGLYIGNAGLVILHPFLLQFFTGLGIAAGDELVKPERALCLLHYLVTGRDVAPEYDLVLPKIMCNVPLTEAVESQVTLTAAEKAEAEALLQTVIRYWDALRNTSPDGLRSAFLLRQGKIALKDAGWLLHVEPKGFDILLSSLPWGLSMVKLPWMNKFLHVEW